MGFHLEDRDQSPIFKLLDIFMNQYEFSKPNVFVRKLSMTIYFAFFIHYLCINLDGIDLILKVVHNLVYVCGLLIHCVRKLDFKQMMDCFKVRMFNEWITNIN